MIESLIKRLREEKGLETAVSHRKFFWINKKGKQRTWKWTISVYHTSGYERHYQKNRLENAVNVVINNELLELK